MEKVTRFVGLDVHAESIAVAVAETKGEVRFLGKIVNRPEPVRKLIAKLGGPRGVRVCYEAGPCGYGLYWQLVEMGVDCRVIAPTLVPVKAGDRVKTDRRDAIKLAGSLRAGELTSVWVPDKAHEALRDLVRARLAAKQDELRHRQQLGKFLLRHSKHRPPKMKAWTKGHLDWIRRCVSFDHAPQQAVLIDHLHEVERVGERIERLEKSIDEAIRQAPEELRALISGLQALRGIARLSAATIATEVGTLRRFARAKQVMGYVGIVSREHSSGDRVRRGSITKTGNAHLRRVVVEAAWAYRFKPDIGRSLRERQAGLSEEIKAIAWKAQHRLHRRFAALLSRNKSRQGAVTAVARELVGFIWAIGQEIERNPQQPSTAVAA